MSQTDYLSALKMGERSSKAAAAKGEFPYLPVLDEFLKTVDVLDEIPLGVMEIPIEQIVGTKTAGRANAFAPNFMPLMKEKSEFATKWVQLIDYQKEEGIKDPIIAYEFMNRYYVLEGNKRVSVFKYLGAFSIEGNVIRVVPRRTADPEIQIFYEYMAFNRHSHINGIWFTKPGCYLELLKALGIDPRHDWTDSEREDFSSAYLRFSKIFEEKGGSKLQITAGDAFLSYITVFPYREIEDKTDVQLKNEITKIWSEFQVITAKTEQTLVMEPEEVTEDSLFSRFLQKMGTAGSKYLNVAFIHEYSSDRSGWTYSHELGRMHLEHVFQGRIRTKAYSLDEYSFDKQAVFDAAAKDGNHIIFSTSETLMTEALKAAVRYPKLKILSCSVNSPHKLIRTYYGRMYEAKFLEGMIAGAMCENDKIAYTASYPIYGIIANINAFSLGAKMTNPRAKVYLHWYAQKGADLDELVSREKISVISDVDAMRPGSRNRRYGLYINRDGYYTSLAMPIWNWGKFYEKILQDILSGSWENAQTRERPALNYWWGISGNIIDIILSRSLPSGIRTLANVMRDQIYNGAFHPFADVITMQDGSRIGAEGNVLSPDQIITMDWLCENVIGSIPDAEEFNDRARSIMEAAGIRRTKEDEL